jgi:hypothetical protein
VKVAIDLQLPVSTGQRVNGAVRHGMGWDGMGWDGTPET